MNYTICYTTKDIDSSSLKINPKARVYEYVYELLPCTDRKLTESIV